MAQNLVTDITITNLAPAGTLTVAHGLTAPDNSGLAPFDCRPDRNTSITVTGITATDVSFRNDGIAAASAIFRIWRYHSIQQFPISPILWQGADSGSGGQQELTNTFFVDPDQAADAASRRYATVDTAMAAALTAVASGQTIEILCKSQTTVYTLTAALPNTHTYILSAQGQAAIDVTGATLAALASTGQSLVVNGGMTLVGTLTVPKGWALVGLSGSGFGSNTTAFVGTLDRATIGVGDLAPTVSISDALLQRASFAMTNDAGGTASSIMLKDCTITHSTLANGKLINAQEATITLLNCEVDCNVVNSAYLLGADAGTVAYVLWDTTIKVISTSLAGSGSYSLTGGAVGVTPSVTWIGTSAMTASSILSGAGAVITLNMGTITGNFPVSSTPTDRFPAAGTIPRGTTIYKGAQPSGALDAGYVGKAQWDGVRAVYDAPCAFFRLRTTGDGATRMTLESFVGAGTALVMSDNTALYFDCRLTAQIVGGAKNLTTRIIGVVQRGAGAGTTAFQAGSPVASPAADTIDNSGATYNFVAIADAVNGGLGFTADGAAGETVNHVGLCFFYQVSLD